MAERTLWFTIFELVVKIMVQPQSTSFSMAAAISSSVSAPSMTVVETRPSKACSR